MYYTKTGKKTRNIHRKPYYTMLRNIMKSEYIHLDVDIHVWRLGLYYRRTTSHHPLNLADGGRLCGPVGHMSAGCCALSIRANFATSRKAPSIFAASFALVLTYEIGWEVETAVGRKPG